MSDIPGELRRTVEEYEKTIWQLDKYRILKSYKLLENCHPGKIVDIGCMGGRDMLPLIQKGWDCYGIEVSEACRIAKERGIKCVQQDVSERIPFRDGFFDVVWAEETIEHLLDTDFFLSEVSRVLKGEGILIVSTPNLASLVNRVKLLAGFPPRYVQSSLQGPGHVRYYTLDVLKNQLAHHGFKVDKAVGNFLSLPDPTRGKRVRGLILAPLATLLPSLSENLILRCKKSVEHEI